MDPSAPRDRFSDECLKEKQERTPNNLVSNCLMSLPLYSPPFVGSSPFAPQLFFFRTPSRALSNNHHSVTPPPVHIVLCNTLVSTLNCCLRKLNDLAFYNPFLNTILSFPSHFQSFCQIPYRNNKNLSILHNHNFAAVLPGDSLAGLVVANGIVNFFTIYNTLLVVRLVLTWFPNTPPAIVSPLSTLCDPYLNIFRGIIPPLGGTLDLSPILAFLVLNAFSSTAAALSAELPPPGLSHISPSITTVSKKRMRRLAGNRSRNSTNDN